jgi:ketosteroid isomerase-like protein
MSHPNAVLITRFYEAFQRRDASAMAACYHADVHFSDEVFPDLRGARAGAMWAMLCARGKDLRIEFSDVVADDVTGGATWNAWYTFSGSGRPVHNVIEASFEFRDGHIVRHVDRFDFWRWSRQALGPAGSLLGWTPFLRGKVRATAARSLEAWIATTR